MGSRGPQRTPTAILRRRGSWRANRNPREPKPERGRPRRPKWLKGSARKLWERLVPELDKMGVLAKSDREALAIFCRLWQRWRKAEEFLDAHGSTHPVRKYNLATGEMEVAGFRPFPQVKESAQLSDQLLRLIREFGLSPAARFRIEAIDDVANGASEGVRRFLKPA